MLKKLAATVAALFLSTAALAQTTTVLPQVVAASAVVDLGAGPLTASVLSGNPLFFTGSGTSACPGSLTSQTTILGSPGNQFPFWTNSHVCVTVNSGPSAQVLPAFLSIGSGSPSTVSLPQVVPAATVVDLGAGPLNVQIVSGNPQFFTGSGTSACPASVTTQPLIAGSPSTTLPFWTASHVCVTVNAGPSAQVLPALLSLSSGGGGSGITGLTGDVTASGTGSVPATLATVNSNVGSFGSATNCPTVTVNAKGLVTAASQATCTPAISSLTGLGTNVGTALGNALSSAGGVASTIASGTATLGTVAIASGACATVVTVSATNVLTTDVVLAGYNGDPTAITGYGASATGAVLSVYPYPSANNVNFKVCNSTGNSITPGAMTLNWRVAR